MKLCDYGCGQEAKYQFKEGKYCCSKNWHSCPAQRKKNSILMEKVWKNLDNNLHSKSRNKMISDAVKQSHKNPKSAYNSKLYKEKQRKAVKLTIEKINIKYPFFSKIEEMRYNPDNPDEKEIQVHCKNHECENSKEKDGWFTPGYWQLSDRIRALESKNGNEASYLYCCQECKDTCFLYNMKSDPFKNNELPYTYQENQLWRQIVLELDKGLCQFCGKLATHVHHIKPVKTHPHLALDPDNGISFCEDCHYKIGHKKGTECSTGNLAKTVQQGCVLGGQQLNNMKG